MRARDVCTRRTDTTQLIQSSTTILELLLIVKYAKQSYCMTKKVQVWEGVACIDHDHDTERFEACFAIVVIN